MILPHVIFYTRVRDDTIEGPNPFKWVEKTTDQYFGKGKYILFSLPGAFTPICSAHQLPNYEKLYSEFKTLGIDEIYCMSVNDAFVMNCWAKDQNIKRVKMIPDGNGEFTNGVDMLVQKNNLGFGMRSWRYAAIIKDGIVEKLLVEPGKDDNVEDDPYSISSPENVMKYLKGEEYIEVRNE
jgi:peroxiredoxin